MKRTPLLLLSFLILFSSSALYASGPVGLVLSGGAAWGIAHVGVLEVLVENEIPIDLVVGTSAGAILGALYAGGLSPDEMKELVEEMSWVHLLTPQLPDLGLFSTEAIENLLLKHLPGDDFSQLPTKLAVVATDLDTGEEIVITKGSVSKGVAASAAIPILYSPVEYGGRFLVDGGLVNNLPICVASMLGAQQIMAVDVSGFVFQDRPQDQIEVVIRAYNILQRTAIVTEGADILIQPDLRGLSSMNLEAYSELMERGREAALEALPIILEIIGGG